MFPLELSLSDRVGHVVKRIPSSACGSKRHVYMMCKGRVIRRSDDLKNSQSGTQAIWTTMTGGTANQMRRVEETDNSRRGKLIQ